MQKICQSLENLATTFYEIIIFKVKMTLDTICNELSKWINKSDIIGSLKIGIIKCFGDKFVEREWKYFEMHVRKTYGKNDNEDSDESGDNEVQDKALPIITALNNNVESVNEVSDTKIHTEVQDNNVSDISIPNTTVKNDALIPNIKPCIKNNIDNNDIEVQPNTQSKTETKITFANNGIKSCIEYSDEVQDNKIHTEPVVNEIEQPKTELSFLEAPKKYIQMLNGEYGEDKVINMIQSIRNKFEISKVSFTGHVADIHATDFDSGIKYVIEVKNKKYITHDDLTKYDKDLNEMKDEEYIIIGMFLSLESDYIPTIGEYKISYNSAYLTKKYINKECLNVIFDYMPMIQKCKTQKTSESATKYIIPENVYHLAYILKTYSNRIYEQIEILQRMKENCLQNAKDVNTVIVNYEISNNLVNEIKSLLNIPSSELQTSLEEKSRLELKKYLKGKDSQKIRKSELLAKYPILKTELAAMKKEDIIEKYSK